MKKQLATILLIVLAFWSCSEQKRCTRHLEKAKELGCLSTSMQTKYDTIFGFKVDTIFKADTLSMTDTFTFIKEGVSVKTIVKWKDKIVYQNVTKDTTIIKTEWKTDTITEYKERTPNWIYFLLGFLGLTIFGLVFKK